MKPSSNSKVLARRPLAVFIFNLLLLVGIIVLAFVTILPTEKLYILMPMLATIVIFLIFTVILKRQIGDNLFGELGFLYLALMLAYTVIPAFTFLIVDLNLASGWVWEKLALLLPAPFELGLHLWRHVIFMFGVGAGYLLVRGRGIPELITTKDPEDKDGLTIVFLIGIVAICILCLSLMSAPVNNYLEHYTRYDHLSWLPRKFVSLCLRLKLGIYSVLTVFLFRQYKKFKFIIPIILVIICAHEILYSLGSRIESLTILLIALCLYNFTIKSVTLKKGVMACICIAVLFSAVELIRSSELNSAQNVVSQEGIQPASEFGAVYFTGFHLYAERAQNAVPPTEWPMFFSDFISVVTFGDFTQWNPQYWYARNYFPDAAVPPETMGPIADSAIWGGEIDLFLRSLINGAYFAYLVRWYLFHKNKWWSIAIYAYCYATCVMTLKYSIFYHLTPLVKTLIPTLLVVEGVRRLIPSRRRVGSPNPV
jgi:hypothetical protein